jgi:ribose 5-phosphate isomerase RpiB
MVNADRQAEFANGALVRRMFRVPTAPAESPADGAPQHDGVLRWPGRVVTAEALQRNLNGHREILVPTNAVITPLAEEQLRSGRVTIQRQPAQSRDARLTTWGYTQDAGHPLIESAVQALAREGTNVELLPGLRQDDFGRWAKEVAACVVAGQYCGGAVFCSDPGLFCCIANKVPGLRAVPVVTVLQAARATLTAGANLLAVEMPGRTFFEIRQILRLLCLGQAPCCPDGVACVLRELDGHAHS